MTHSRDHVGCVLTAGPWEQGRPPKLATLVQMWSQGMLSPLPNTKPEMTPQAATLKPAPRWEAPWVPHGQTARRPEGAADGFRGERAAPPKTRPGGAAARAAAPSWKPRAWGPRGPGAAEARSVEVSLPTRPSSECKSDSPQEQGAGVLIPRSQAASRAPTLRGKWNPTPQHLDLVPPTQDPRYQPNHCWEQAQPPGQQEMSKTSTQRRITACI